MLADAITANRRPMRWLLSRLALEELRTVADVDLGHPTNPYGGYMGVAISAARPANGLNIELISEVGDDTIARMTVAFTPQQ
ncbi:hypothetical protein GCM10011404_04810 [Sphingomonas prati]|nr:hypothetical protein GCM10011404_04810 [Sphingomonas prati]